MLFSMIIPVYNTELYLSECINSVLKQSFHDYEIILVDDGSTDSSGEICDRYAKENLNIRVIHKANGGQSSARNIGILSAQGEYLTFLDSDDILCKDSYFNKIAEKTQIGFDIILFKYCKYYSPDHISKCQIDMSGLQGLSKPELLYTLVSRDSFFCSCWSKTVKRSIITENGLLFDESLNCEDMDWFFSVVEKAETITAIDESFIYYRQRDCSVTTTFKPKTVEDFIYTLKKWDAIFETKPEGKEKEAMLSALAKLYCNLLIFYSRYMKRMSNNKKDIFSFRPLLRHRLNPRTKIISLCTRIIGIGNTCRLLSIADKIKRG